MRHLDSLLTYIHGLFPPGQDEKIPADVGGKKVPIEEPVFDNDERQVIEPIEGLGYGHSSLCWCFMTSDFKQGSKFTTCRDYLNDSLLAFLRGSHSSYYPLNGPTIGLDRLRLLFSKANKRDIVSAIKAINAYSRLAGWEDDARGLRCKMHGSDSNKWFDMYLLEANSNWMRYPQLLSLLVLFVRMSRRCGITIPDHIKTAYELEGFFSEAVNNDPRWLDARKNDENYLANCYRWLVPMFVHEKEIFNKLDGEAWKESGSFHDRSGIYSFIRRGVDSTHKTEAEKLRSFYESEVLAYEGKES